MRKSVLLLTSLALVVLLACGVALAAAGDLDLSFGEGGKLTGTGKGYGAAIQPDGKIVVAGSSQSFTETGYEEGAFLLTRRLPDGKPDESFGGGDGLVSTSMSGKSRGARVADVLIQPDGKIVAAGFARFGSRFSAWYALALVRYKSDGTLDKTFGGGDGKVLTDPAGIESSEANAVLRQPNGKLVVAGCADRRFLVARYLTDGRRDGGFGGGDGVVTTRLGRYCRGGDLALQPDGKLVVLGTSFKPYPTGGSKDYDFALARYEPDGRLDDSFGGGDGKAFADFGTKSDEGRALVLLPDGKMVVAGQAGQYWGAPTFALARFKPRGVLDGTFGTGDGKVVGPSGAAEDLVAQPDGKLVAAGNARPDLALVRYRPNGSPDDSFGGGDGVVLTDFGSPAYYDYANALVRQGDGKLVAVGTSVYDDDFYLHFRIVAARYLAD